ncbi:MAG: TrkA C-terminal domain-containing protein, partial [Sphaerochaetaceae bacterium]
VKKSLGDLRFWNQTGATVIAIRREGAIILSPGPKLLLEENDVLVIVGNQHTKAYVEKLIS